MRGGTEARHQKLPKTFPEPFLPKLRGTVRQLGAKPAAPREGVPPHVAARGGGPPLPHLGEGAPLAPTHLLGVRRARGLPQSPPLMCRRMLEKLCSLRRPGWHERRKNRSGGRRNKPAGGASKIVGNFIKTIVVLTGTTSRTDRMV